MHISDPVAVTLILSTAFTIAVIWNKGWFRFKSDERSMELEAKSIDHMRETANDTVHLPGTKPDQPIVP